MADPSNTSSPIPALHQHRIADLIESEENRTVLANVIRRVLQDRRENLVAHQSAAVGTEPDD